MPFYSSHASDSDSIKINHVRQNGCQLQLLRAHDSDKTEDGDFIASYLVTITLLSKELATF